MFGEQGPVLLLSAPDAARVEPSGEPDVEQANVPATPEGLDLEAVLWELAGREINEVLVEAGATLSGAFLRAGLVDELVIYMAPKLMGDGARGLFHLPGLPMMADAVALEIQDIRAVGADWRITAKVSNG